jgi:hypothetical protein
MATLREIFGRKSNDDEPAEVQAMREGFRQAGRRMAIHDALAPLRPNQIDPSTGRTNRETRELRRARGG